MDNNALGDDFEDSDLLSAVKDANKELQKIQNKLRISRNIIIALVVVIVAVVVVGYLGYRSNRSANQKFNRQLELINELNVSILLSRCESANDSFESLRNVTIQQSVESAEAIITVATRPGQEVDKAAIDAYRNEARRRGEKLAAQIKDRNCDEEVAVLEESLDKE